jgi:saccharopine dehydrogenase (NAD+, L-lysine-forming)
MGGYGNTGRLLSGLLLKYSEVNLALGGRNLEKAETLAKELNHDHGGERVRGIHLDAADINSLLPVFKEVDFVVVASSTTEYIPLAAQAALEIRIGYIDIQYSSKKNRYLRSIESSIQQAGCCFITDGGFHPGLPAFLVRYAAQFFDNIDTARVGSVIKQDWRNLDVADSTIIELIDLMNDFDMSIYTGGQWKRARLVSTADYLKMDFGPGFSKQTCAPMLLEEMRSLPTIFPELRETGFYVGSFNWFTDWVIMPIAMVAIKVWPNAAKKPMARWMHWGLKRFSKPPFATILQVEVSGRKDGHPKRVRIRISHDDGYMFTAIPVVACMMQYLDGTIAKPGLWWQALCVEPLRFMMDMQRMGIKVTQDEGD